MLVKCTRIVSLIHTQNYKIENQNSTQNEVGTQNSCCVFAVCSEFSTNDPAGNRHLWSRERKRERERELSREREAEVVRLFSSGERTKSIIRSAIEPRLDRNANVTVVL